MDSKIYITHIGDGAGNNGQSFGVPKALIDHQKEKKLKKLKAKKLAVKSLDRLQDI